MILVTKPSFGDISLRNVINPHKSDAIPKIKDTLEGTEWSSRVSFISN